MHALFTITFGALWLCSFQQDFVPQPKVVNGDAVTPAFKYSFMVRIYLITLQYPGHYCGGSLLNEQWILTAAHCSDQHEWLYEVEIHRHNLSNSISNEAAVVRKVTQIIRHPNYGEVNENNNDIAVWKLDEPIELGNGIEPATLDKGTHDAVGNQVSVIGWGSIKDVDGPYAPLPDILQIAPLEISACEDAVYFNWYWFDSSEICAGSSNTNPSDSCFGDSGGPIFDTLTEIVVGIVSWGVGCGLGPRWPTIYSRVADPENREFIETYVDGIRWGPAGPGNPGNAATCPQKDGFELYSDRGQAGGMCYNPSTTTPCARDCINACARDCTDDPTCVAFDWDTHWCCMWDYLPTSLTSSQTCTYFHVETEGSHPTLPTLDSDSAISEEVLASPDPDHVPNSNTVGEFMESSDGGSIDSERTDYSCSAIHGRLVGPDIGDDVYNVSQKYCCAACSQTAECVAWTYKASEQKCKLKAYINGDVYDYDSYVYGLNLMGSAMTIIDSEHSENLEDLEDVDNFEISEDMEEDDEPERSRHRTRSPQPTSESELTPEREDANFTDGECGNCDVAHEREGCSNSQIEDCVCEYDSTCCRPGRNFDEFCAVSAIVECGCSGQGFTTRCIDDFCLGLPGESCTQACDGFGLSCNSQYPEVSLETLELFGSCSTHYSTADYSRCEHPGFISTLNPLRFSGHCVGYDGLPSAIDCGCYDSDTIRLCHCGQSRDNDSASPSEVENQSQVEGDHIPESSPGQGAEQNPEIASDSTDFEASPECSVSFPEYLGDGWCDWDTIGSYNTEECDWDDGDCCELTCVARQYECGENSYICDNPSISTKSYVLDLMRVS